IDRRIEKVIQYDNVDPEFLKERSGNIRSPKAWLGASISYWTPLISEWARAVTKLAFGCPDFTAPARARSRNTSDSLWTTLSRSTANRSFDIFKIVSRTHPYVSASRPLPTVTSL